MKIEVSISRDTDRRNTLRTYADEIATNLLEKREAIIKDALNAMLGRTFVVDDISRMNLDLEVHYLGRGIEVYTVNGCNLVTFYQPEFELIETDDRRQIMNAMFEYSIHKHTDPDLEGFNLSDCL